MPPSATGRQSGSASAVASAGTGRVPKRSSFSQRLGERSLRSTVPSGLNRTNGSPW